MTAEEFRAHLIELGWAQVGLERRLNAASGPTGQKVAASTVNRWAQGRHPVPAGVAAYLRLALRIKQLGV